MKSENPAFRAITIDASYAMNKENDLEYTSICEGITSKRGEDDYGYCGKLYALSIWITEN